MRIGVLLAIDDKGDYYARGPKGAWINLGKAPEDVQGHKDALNAIKMAGGKDGKMEFARYQIMYSGQMPSKRGLFDKSLPETLVALRKQVAEAEKKNPAPKPPVKGLNDYVCADLVPMAERLGIDIVQAERQAAKNRVSLKAELVKQISEAKPKKEKPPKSVE